ncbi:hypothetical protein BVRB_7g173400 isoform A [Beta vulgaris subsp. vulgaris]|nr:hypothetical protein BVRB_7g173400 isoform A [Beta vulgaris subsp. vulgaris]
MAELDGMQQNKGTPRTIEQLLHSESPTSWNTSVTGRIHEEDDHGKKISVIAKVKEKAKKWRQSLARKKSGHDSNNTNTPSWGVALEDYEIVDEPENHGSLACESQLTPKSSKDHTPSPRRRQQRANSFMGSNVKYLSDNQLRERLPTLKTAEPVMGKSHSDHLAGHRSLSGADINKSPRAVSLGNHLRENHASPSKFALEALIAQRNSFKQKEKQCLPDLTTEITSTETSINGKATTEVVIEENKRELEPLNPNVDEEEVKKPHSPTKTTETESLSESRNVTKEQDQQQSPTTNTTMTEAVSQKLAPAYTTVSEATYKLTSKLPKLSTTNLPCTQQEHKWNKGVSVKEFFKNKLEPGEDEKALSQVITEVISPRRSPNEKGVVEKVKAAVTMLLQTEEPSSPSLMENSQIPVSTNAYEVEEDHQGRILQAN